MRLSSLVAVTFTLAALSCAGTNAADPPMATPQSASTGGCKSVATFTSSAVPALQKDGCIGCHGGGSASASGVLDLSNVGKDDAAACVQSLKKVNLANKAQSAMIQAPAGAQTHGGGKVADGTAYTTALMGWINNE